MSYWSGCVPEQAVVLSGQQRAAGDAAAVVVVERLDDLLVQIVDLRREACDPALELLAACDRLTSGDVSPPVTL
jgi:hypothetical protein